MSDSESENEVIDLGEEDSGEEDSNDSGDDSEGAGPTMKDLYEGNVVSGHALLSNYTLRTISYVVWCFIFSG